MKEEKSKTEELAERILKAWDELIKTIHFLIWIYVVICLIKWNWVIAVPIIFLIGLSKWGYICVKEKDYQGLAIWGATCACIVAGIVYFLYPTFFR